MGKNKLAGCLFAASVGFGILAWTPAGAPAQAGTTATGGTAGVPAASKESGTLNCTQLESLWLAGGGSPSAAHMAAQIAMAESSGRQYATLVDSNGTTDEGYWQINTSHGSLATYDPLGNARAAVAISSNGTDWSPWVTYQKGLYVGLC